MKKQHIIEACRRELEAVVKLRHAAKKCSATGAAMAALKAYQSQRMAITHADLLAAPDTNAAARFFLDDLYGPKDFTKRDADIERIIPLSEHILPTSALQTIAEAVTLDALSETMDNAMAARLGERFTEEDYIASYREVTSRADRERQIAHVRSLGASLCGLVRKPLLGSTLKIMRGPARLANLGELHDFLERGFAAFRGMRDAAGFVSTIVTRETAIMEAIYAGRKRPFAQESLPV
jgi:hypothetical protein